MENISGWNALAVVESLSNKTEKIDPHSDLKNQDQDEIQTIANNDDATLKKFQEQEKFLNNSTLGMKETIKYILASQICGRPILLIGLPGCAKSYVSKLSASCFGDRDKEWAYVAITPNTTKEAVFGGIIAEEFLKGIETYNLDAGIVKKPIAIIDEIFKSENKDLLDSFLYYLDEESTFKSGDRTHRTARQFTVMTSNELPEPGIFDALMNRINIKHFVKDLTGKNRMLAVKMASDRSSSPLMPPSFTISDILEARVKACEVVVPDSILELLSYDEEFEKVCESAARNGTKAPKRSESRAIFDKLEEYGVRVSQRQFQQLCAENKNGLPSFLQAIAWLHGDLEVDESHLIWLTDALWNIPEQRQYIHRIFSNIDTASEIKDDVVLVRQFVNEHCQLELSSVSKMTLESLQEWHKRANVNILPIIREIIQKHTKNEDGSSRNLSKKAILALQEITQHSKELLEKTKIVNEVVISKSKKR